ncbi:uncharacterized protein LOC124299349 [Neodiprion virginianus]|uniref:uncharacterized protein LOC124299349 n=1 Tax=Neodiprion virginianus TaxID=2961670 RepID=UPI001EE6B98E|nr:uncharacterized protein LOC124299349 [Neodiprion virginianus]
MFRTNPKYRRLEMVIKDEVPVQAEIRERMGSSMAQVFFDHGHPDSRKLLGVIPPLKGPREELWISPSDQLIQKVALVPPLTNKCIKACTHQGILGKQAMEKYEHELYDKMVKKYEEDNKDTRNMFEAEKRRAIQLAEQELQLKYEKYIQNLQEEFKQNLQVTITSIIALAEAFQKCSKSMQKVVIRERIEVTKMMLKKLRDEISYVVTSIYENFEHSIRIQKENMVADFNEIIRRERAKTDVKMKEMERNKNEALQVQRHELEMQNFADVTYVLCLERMRASSEKHAIHLGFEYDEHTNFVALVRRLTLLGSEEERAWLDQYGIVLGDQLIVSVTVLDESHQFTGVESFVQAKQIQALKNMVIEANDILQLMKTETAAKATNDKLWENKLIEVVREFQKFINFALRAVPGQAEFLLSLESLLILEADDKLREQTEPEKEESETFQTHANPQIDIVEIIDPSGERWLPMELIPNLQPKLHCTKEQLMSSIVKSEIDLCSNKEYIVDKVRKASIISLNSYDSLPFCFLDQTLYVRSDFREKNEPMTKTMLQLAAEGSRFIMEMKNQKPCNLNTTDNSRASILSSNTSESSLRNNSVADTIPAVAPEYTVLDQKLTKSISIMNRASETSSLQSAHINHAQDNASIHSSKMNGIRNHLKMADNVSVNFKDSGQMFKVIGEDGIEHLQTPSDFTCARMRSLIRIFKLHPSLQQIMIPKANEVLY